MAATGKMASVLPVLGSAATDSRASIAAVTGPLRDGLAWRDLAVAVTAAAAAPTPLYDHAGDAAVMNASSRDVAVVTGVYTRRVSRLDVSASMGVPVAVYCMRRGGSGGTTGLDAATGAAAAMLPLPPPAVGA